MDWLRRLYYSSKSAFRPPVANPQKLAKNLVDIASFHEKNVIPNSLVGKEMEASFLKRILEKNMSDVSVLSNFKNIPPDPIKFYRYGGFSHWLSEPFGRHFLKARHIAVEFTNPESYERTSMFFTTNNKIPGYSFFEIPYKYSETPGSNREGQFVVLQLVTNADIFSKKKEFMHSEEFFEKNKKEIYAAIDEALKLDIKVDFLQLVFFKGN